MNVLTFDIFNAVLSVVSDLVIVLLPIPIIYSLKASRMKKG